MSTISSEKALVMLLNKKGSSSCIDHKWMTELDHADCYNLFLRSFPSRTATFGYYVGQRLNFMPTETM